MNEYSETINQRNINKVAGMSCDQTSLCDRVIDQSNVFI